MWGLQRRKTTHSRMHLGQKHTCKYTVKLAVGLWITFMLFVHLHCRYNEEKCVSIYLKTVLKAKSNNRRW